jgi:isoleucyl-tRNA synthetase
LPDGTARVVTVALDTALDDALRAEGVAREFVNRVQNLRKEAGFAVSDRIALTFQAPPATSEALLRHAATIQAETLAPEFGPADVPHGDATATADFGDGPVVLAVRRS